jgi:hypothetical protein
MGFQSCESFNFENFGTFNLGVSGQNDIWVQALWPSIKNIMKGKVLVSPKSRLWWVLWVHVCLRLICAPKCSNYALINLLFGLCKSVWIIDLLVICPSPYPRVPTCPFTHEVLQARERTPTPCPSVVFTFQLVVESIKEFGGVSVHVSWWHTLCSLSGIKG